MRTVHCMGKTRPDLESAHQAGRFRVQEHLARTNRSGPKSTQHLIIYK